ncbi:MAG: HAD family phosphatase, partial [Clostridia bacterium]|nr:HAD family phosphatase [Clostridia bacterium]
CLFLCLNRDLGAGMNVDFYDLDWKPMPFERKYHASGELSPKPHPWLYSETSIVGLGEAFADRSRVVGIEDSGAGACSVRLAGYTTIGIAGGNIESSGTKAVCSHFCNNFEEIMKIIKG